MPVRILRVETDEEGMRLDRWLRRRIPGLPQGRIGRLVRTGKIRIDGRKTEIGQRLRSGAEVRVPPLASAGQQRSRPVLRTAPDDIRRFERSILYRNASVLAIDKPSGLAVQGGTGQSRSVDRIAAAWAGRNREAPRLVHRIDRDTSGVVLLALNRQSAVSLAAAFRDRRVRKTYWAAVEGAPERAQGMLSGPLVQDERSGRRRTRVAADDDPGARDASTEYATLATAADGGCAWLALRPHTGRTHQIRSHLSAAGSPVLGDSRYGAGRAGVSGAAPRLCLHARSLRFPDPETGAAVEVAAPLDEALRRVWAKMGWHAADAPADPFRDA